MSDALNHSDDETLREFLSESWENLGALDNEIVLLEKDPNNSDLLASIFRTIHTIKGSCGFVGLHRLGEVSHSTENVLGRMRDGALDVSPSAISIVLEAVDAIKDLLDHIESTGSEPEVDHSKLINKLELLTSLAMPLGEPTKPAAPPVENTQPQEAEDEANLPADSPSPPDQPKPSAAEEMVTPTIEPSSNLGGDEEKKPQNRPSADLSIRVNVDVLDQLMNLVGELVLTRNQLLQIARGDEESRYAAPISHLNRVTTDLQEGVMKTRMQPIGNAWSKLPRLVRDLSTSLGRQMELEMSGAETELDRTVLDAIKDPLTHMVRNSADHGIETPEERRNAGKPDVGRIRLNAYHEGGHVIIDIEDDGRGIDTRRVLAKAIQRGLTTETDARKLSDNEILRFIFTPGFSTADQISSVSGRGVGMDVVLTQVERIGGTVELSSRFGQGTTIRIKIPLTLAIISALIVECGGESFAIPQLGVVELVRLATEDRDQIERIHQNPVFRLRDRLLPLVYLDHTLNLDALSGPDQDDHDINIVVVQVGDEQFGVIVSEVFDTEEIVVKPLGSLLKDVGVYQGATILGDGRVVMILDVAGIASRSGGRSAHETRSDSSSELARDVASKTTNLLLFDSGSGHTMAVPLALVSRLEEFTAERIERAGERVVVQYRGELLPLLSLEGSMSGELQDPQSVLVFSEDNKSMGLIVRKILDIVDEELILSMRSNRPGVLGTAIINGAATDIIDTKHYLSLAHPDWYSRKPVQQTNRIFIVDDSAFFRQLIKTNLEIEGHNVLTFDDARVAMKAIEAGTQFDVLITDIEMPNVDGYTLLKWLKSQPQCQQKIIFAMSSLNTPNVEQKALKSGADRFVAKSNLGNLMDEIEEFRRNFHNGENMEARA